MDRTWTIKISITLGGETRDYSIGPHDLPTTGFFAEGSKAYAEASAVIFEHMRVSACQTIYNLGSNNWWSVSRNPGADMGSGEFRGRTDRPSSATDKGYW